MRVQCREYQVEEVDRESKVGYELAARDENDDCDRPNGQDIISTEMVAGVCCPRGRADSERSGEVNLHDESSVQNPDKSHKPTLCSIATNTFPTQDEVQAKGDASNKRSKDQQDERGEVIHCLQRSDLSSDFQGRQLGECTSAWWSASSRHGKYEVGLCEKEWRVLVEAIRSKSRFWKVKGATRSAKMRA